MSCIEALAAAGVAPHLIAMVAEELAQARVSATPARTSRQERNARYYEKQRRLKASEQDVSDAIKTLSDAPVESISPPRDINSTPLDPSLRSGLIPYPSEPSVPTVTPHGQPAEPIEVDLLGETPKPTPPARKKRISADSDMVLLDQITDVWNAFAAQHGLAQVQGLTETRGRHCRQRINYLRTLGHQDPADGFRYALSFAAESFFIRGSPRNPLTFDQMMRESFLIKLLEGAYVYKERNYGQGQSYGARA